MKSKLDMINECEECLNLITDIQTIDKKINEKFQEIEKLMKKK